MDFIYTLARRICKILTYLIVQPWRQINTRNRFYYTLIIFQIYSFELTIFLSQSFIYRLQNILKFSFQARSFFFNTLIKANSLIAYFSITPNRSTLDFRSFITKSPFYFESISFKNLIFKSSSKYFISNNYYFQKWFTCTKIPYIDFKNTLSHHNIPKSHSRAFLTLSLMRYYSSDKSYPLFKICCTR